MTTGMKFDQGDLLPTALLCFAVARRPERKVDERCWVNEHKLSTEVFLLAAVVLLYHDALTP